MIVFSRSIVISPDHVQHRSGRNFALEPAFFEDDSQMETTTSYKPVPAFKQARKLMKYFRKSKSLGMSFFAYRCPQGARA